MKSTNRIKENDFDCIQAMAHCADTILTSCTVCRISHPHFTALNTVIVFSI